MLVQRKVVSVFVPRFHCAASLEMIIPQTITNAIQQIKSFERLGRQRSLLLMQMAVA
jgi:hypothetical protein